MNIKVKALNTAMGKMSIDPLQKEKKILLAESSNFEQSSLIRANLQDFTSMTVDEREEFFRKSGVTLYEYDKELPEPEDFPQQKQTWLKKLKSKKVNILEDQPETSSRRRKTKGNVDNDGIELVTLKSRVKTAKSARSAKLDEDNQRSDSETSDTKLMSSLAVENSENRSWSPSADSEGSVDSDNSASEDNPEENEPLVESRKSAEESNADEKNQKSEEYGALQTRAETKTPVETSDSDQANGKPNEPDQAETRKSADESNPDQNNGK